MSEEKSTAAAIESADEPEPELEQTPGPDAELLAPGAEAEGDVVEGPPEPFETPQGGPEAPVEPADELAEATPEALARDLEAARRAAEEHWEMVLRTRAELENLRKRAERDVANAHKFGLERMLNELLPVVDSLELGLSAAHGDDVGVATVREGMELTLKMMAGALEKMGVTEVNPQGQGFDPELHQAMSMQEAEGGDPGTVMTVVQKGYVLNERLVRPALVIVSK